MPTLSPAANAIAPELFQLLPPHQAMDGARRTPEILSAAAMAVCSPVAGKNPEIGAAIWLYVDDLEAAHQIVQSLKSPSADWLHAIVHRREGDFGNAMYWYRHAEKHPLRTLWSPGVPLGGPFPSEVQQEEWVQLFNWLADNTV